MDLNVRSAFNIFRAVIPRMRAAGRGRIVAIASRAAAEPAANIAAYGASKAALLSLVRSAAAENKDVGITVWWCFLLPMPPHRLPGQRFPFMDGRLECIAEIFLSRR